MNKEYVLETLTQRRKDSKDTKNPMPSKGFDEKPADDNAPENELGRNPDQIAYKRPGSRLKGFFFAATSKDLGQQSSDEGAGRTGKPLRQQNKEW